MTEAGVRLEYPFDAAEILKKKKAIRRELLAARSDFLDKRIAILGGSTTAEVRNILELFLLKDGIRPTFYETAFGKYDEEVLFGQAALREFRPELVYVHTSGANVRSFPSVSDSPADVDKRLSEETARWEAVWNAIGTSFNCPIIQNNFELPFYRTLGNLDFAEIRGRTNFISRLNAAVARYAQSHPNFFVNDIHYLSAWFGLERWLDPVAWHAYKYAMAVDAIPLLAHSVTTIIRAICGRSKKCLVVDLDNTLWGGVIGDDGVDRLQMGRENAVGGAYSAFQEYVKDLRSRGVLLAIASKNDPAVAEEGLNHPDCLLKRADFAARQINWDPKPGNLEAIARDLNIGADSLVFIDDNPAERAMVRGQLTRVGVPEADGDVTRFITCLDKEGYFEPVALVADDVSRGAYYDQNQQRQAEQAKFATYEEFLKSLEMRAEIGPFKTIYLDRITQLTNKTNQFNLTTRRYTGPEIAAAAADPKCITLYARLSDRFGDNGLVSVLIARMEGVQAHIDLWLMSCRVFNRKLELAMFDALIGQCRQRGIRELGGDYIKTAKNAIVAKLYADLGFQPLSQGENGDSMWRYTVPETYTAKNQVIEVTA